MTEGQFIIITEINAAPAAPHEESVHPDDSNRSYATYNNPPKCPAPWSSDWRSAHGNLQEEIQWDMLETTFTAIPVMYVGQ